MMRHVVDGQPAAGEEAMGLQVIRPGVGEAQAAIVMVEGELVLGDRQTERHQTGQENQAVQVSGAAAQQCRHAAPPALGRMTR